MQNFLSIMIHESREVTVRSSSPRNGEINIKVLKKRPDVFAETRGVIGTESTFPQTSFTNLLRLNWTKLFFSVMGNSQMAADMKIPSLPDDDDGLGNGSRFTTTIFSESGKMQFRSSNQSRF